MHLIMSLKNEFCFDLPMFSKYPDTSINRYFHKMTLAIPKSFCTVLFMGKIKILQLFGPILFCGVLIK